ncbi:MAG TPA: hypothetical protein VLB67_04260, partial [Acidimicrobiia bacterium]|nr:hypothetical protein [Acidimicrobiia bacterium]
MRNRETRTSRNIILVAMLAAVLSGFVARVAFVERSDFGAGDLVLYEQRPYGIDLPDGYAERPFWMTWSRGDGQAYVTLAADPWAQEQALGLRVTLYRYSRIGYSWAALLAVGGQAHLVPYGLFVVNVLSLAALGWIVGRNLGAWGARSIILLAVPGALIATATDTAEAFGLALATLALVLPAAGGVVSAFFLGIVRPDFATALFLRGRHGLPL